MNKHRNKRNKERKDGFIGRLFANTKIPAQVTEEPDWYLDTPDVRLTKVFTVVLILHVVAVGGIVAFKMIEKASAPAAVLVEAAPKAPAAPTPKTPSVAEVPAPVAPVPAPAVKETPRPAPAATKEEKAVVMDHPSAEGYREYRVVIGDTVSSVARKMNVDESELRELNHLGPRDSLPSGKWLLLPQPANASPKEPAAMGKIAADSSKPEEKKAEEKKTDPPAESKEVARVDPPAEKKAAEKLPAKESPPARPENYKVQKGDTPYGIARRFGVDLKDLMAANGIDKPENLRAGQTVVIPKN